MVPDPPVFGTGHGPQFDAAVVHLKRLYQLGAMVEQSMLEIDGRERRGKLAQIVRRCANQAAELSDSSSVSARSVCCSPGTISSSRSALSRLASTRIGRAFDGAGMSAIGARFDGVIEFAERKIALVIRP